MPKPAALALSTACLLAAIGLFVAGEGSAAAAALGTAFVFDALYVKALLRDRDGKGTRT